MRCNLRMQWLGIIDDPPRSADWRTLVVHTLVPICIARQVVEIPRYAAVMLDTNKARIFVFGAAEEREEKVVGEKTRRTSKGGWSQARYQRRADNFHMHHIKEVVETLDKIVREEGLSQVVVSAGEQALPILREQLPKHLAE